MSITTSAASVVGTGNGATTVWPYSFVIPYLSDGVTPAVTVTLVNLTTNIATILTPAQYAISGVGNPAGGNVTYAPALAAGNVIVIERAVPYTQTASVLNQGFFPNVVETIADSLELQLQQLAAAITRSVRAPAGDGPIDMVLPLAGLRAGKFLAFDGTGKPTISSGTGNDSALRTDLASSVVTNGDALVTQKRALTSGVAITLHDWIEAHPVEGREYGVLANGADMVTAINAIMTDLNGVGGGKIIMPRGGITISDKIIWGNNVYLEGMGIGATTITSSGTNKAIFDVSDKIRCGAKGFTLIGGVANALTPIINAVATTADITELLLEDIYIESMGDNAIGIDLQSGATKIVYFANIRNVSIKGGGAGVYQNKIGMRVGTVGNLPVVRPKCYGGRMWRMDYGLTMNNCSGLEWYGISMDDINGANGIGLNFGTANDCHIYGFQAEAGTFKKYAQFGALSTYNSVYCDAVEPTPSQWVDSGTKNSLTGQTGSGGVPNYDGMPRDFNAQVRITSSTDFVQYKRNWSNVAIGNINGGANSGPIGVLGSRASKTVRAEFSFYGREVTTNAAWELRGRIVADWDAGSALLTYGGVEDTEAASTGLNVWNGAYAIGTITMSAAGGVVRMQLNNIGANQLRGVRLDIVSIEADTA